MYKLLIVDDHEMIRDAIRTYFEGNNEFIITAEAENGRQALDKLKSGEFNIVLTDINMPEMDGVELLSEIKKDYPTVKVLVLTMFDDVHQVKKMIENGCNGYLLKNASKSELISALKDIVSGKDYYSREIYDVLIQSMTKHKPRQRLTYEVGISEREKEVLELIVREFSNKEIAEKLFISVRTVETHKRNLLEKTGCKNVAGLAIYAVERGLV